MARYFQKITGLAGVSGPSVGILPEDDALGFIPDWALLLDPAYLAAGVTGGLYNRVDNAQLLNRGGESGNGLAVPIGAMPGSSHPAFAPSDAAAMSITAPVAINRDRWTFFTAGRWNAGTNTQHLVLPFVANAAPTDGVHARVGVTNTGGNARIWGLGTGADSTGDRRVSSQNLTLTTGLSLMLWSFSVERGLTIRQNGVEVGRNDADRRRLTAGYAANQWRMFSFMRGLFGMTGLINRELAALENWAHLTSLETFLMQKYGIA